MEVFDSLMFIFELSSGTARHPLEFSLFIIKFLKIKISIIYGGRTKN